MAFKRVVTSDTNLQTLQDNVQAALASASPLSNGVVVGSMQKPIALSSGANTVPHGLKRPPAYWTLLDNTGNAVVYRTKSDSTNLYLTASSATAVIIWVA